MSAIHYIARAWLTLGATTVCHEVDGIFQPIAECSGFGNSSEEAEATAAQIVAALNGNVAASHQRLKEALTHLMAVFPTDTDMAEAGWTTAEINAACDAHDRAREALKDAP
jgi:hypothetical protein